MHFSYNTLPGFYRVLITASVVYLRSFHYHDNPYQCKNARVYLSRPSRSKLLRRPHMAREPVRALPPGEEVPYLNCQSLDLPLLIPMLLYQIDPTSYILHPTSYILHPTHASCYDATISFTLLNHLVDVPLQPALAMVC